MKRKDELGNIFWSTLVAMRRRGGAPSSPLKAATAIFPHPPQYVLCLVNVYHHHIRAKTKSNFLDSNQINIANILMNYFLIFISISLRNHQRHPHKTLWAFVIHHHHQKVTKSSKNFTIQFIIFKLLSFYISMEISKIMVVRLIGIIIIIIIIILGSSRGKTSLLSF